LFRAGGRGWPGPPVPAPRGLSGRARAPAPWSGAGALGFSGRARAPAPWSGAGALALNWAVSDGQLNTWKKMFPAEDALVVASSPRTRAGPYTVEVLGTGAGVLQPLVVSVWKLMWAPCAAL
jgi:hypothetical protein